MPALSDSRNPGWEDRAGRRRLQIGEAPGVRSARVVLAWIAFQVRGRREVTVAAVDRRRDFGQMEVVVLPAVELVERIVSEPVVGAVAIDEQRIAVLRGGVQAGRRLPIRQEVLRLVVPESDACVRIGALLELVVVANEAGLAVVGHRHGITGVHPENVVGQSSVLG